MTFKVALKCFTLLYFFHSLDASLRNTMNKGINYIAGEWKNIDAKEDPFRYTTRFWKSWLRGREYKVGEKGGKGFGCPSKKEDEYMLLFLGLGSKQGRLDLILPNFQK